MNELTAAEAKAAYEAARDRYYKTGEEEDLNEFARRVAAWQAAVNRGSENQRPPDGPTGIEARVCGDIAARQQVGLAKYGVSVEGSPDDMLRHAYEEALDLSVYLRAEWERRQWQPIETAPRDGRLILAWERGTRIAWWGEVDSSNTHGWASGELAHDEAWWHDECQPTLWMPLPKPPA